MYPSLLLLGVFVAVSLGFTLLLFECTASQQSRQHVIPSLARKQQSVVGCCCSEVKSIQEAVPGWVSTVACTTLNKNK